MKPRKRPQLGSRIGTSTTPDRNVWGLSTSVVKAFATLDVLASKGQSGAPLTEIAERLQMSKSTTHRYLMTLERLRAVERGDKDRFRLGIKLIELAGTILSNNDLRKEAEAFLNELALQTQETVHLAVPSGNDVVYIAKADSTHPIQMYSRIGARMPMYSTALGKAILAHSPATLVDQAIHGGLHARTPNTITSSRALLAELVHVKSQGFATDDQENEAGVCCVGACIFDYNAKVIGAISVSGPAQRMTKERRLELGPLVRDVALRLSKRMGYSR
jgi:IclR family acetate operon transcriptional repressor